MADPSNSLRTAHFAGMLRSTMAKDGDVKSGSGKARSEGLDPEANDHLDEDLGVKQAESAADDPEASADEAESESSEAPGRTTSARPGRDSSVSRADASVPEEDVPQTEQELNVPKFQTIGMLGVVSFLLLILWFSARLSCNAHPDQVREPKHFSTAALVKDPKNAAMEFHHAFETHDFTLATDLCAGALKETVDQRLQECEKDFEACEKRQKELANTIESLPRVTERQGNRATVEITSVYGGKETRGFTYTVVQNQGQWKVTERRDGVVARPAAAEASVSKPGAAEPGEVAADASAKQDGQPAAAEPRPNDEAEPAPRPAPEPVPAQPSDQPE